VSGDCAYGLRGGFYDRDVSGSFSYLFSNFLEIKDDLGF